MSSVITTAGRTLMNQLAGDELPLVIDRMVLAMIPGLDTSGAADPDQQLPDAEYIVYTYDIPDDYKGYVDADQVVYSMILGSDIGEFSFNWIGLLEAETDTVITVTVTPESSKWATDLSTNTTGNMVTRNVILSYQDAQNLTGITVAAETWQFDYQADLSTHIASIVDPTQEGDEPKHVTNSIAKLWEDHLTDTLLHAGKNILINGNFDIWQRGTSQTAHGYGSDDRWHNAHSGSTKTHSQQEFTTGQTDVPGKPKYYSRTVVTSTETESAYVAKVQKIEGVNSLAGETVTISFWAKADTAGKQIAIEFYQNFGTTGSPSNFVTAIGVNKFTLSDAWAKYTATALIPSILGKTLGTDGNDTLVFEFWFDAGSNYDDRTDSLGNQSGTFDIAQVQVEKGEIATDFERRLPGVELALCQRYFYNAGRTSESYPGYAGHAISSTQAKVFGTLPVTMRCQPSLTGYSGNWGLSNSTGVLKTATDITMLVGGSNQTISLTVTISSGLSAGDATALTSSDSISPLYLDAEL